MEEIIAEVESAGTRFNAVTAVTDGRAKELARQSAERLAGGEPRRQLEGMPFAVKDVIDLAGYPTTMGSAVRSDSAVTTSALVVSRLEDAGAIPVAKTNCQEYSYGILGDESAFGRVINPIDPDLCTAGSSSGSAAMVAADAVPLALGTDTAGSVRVPAACQGVLGFKPSFGAVPVEGVFPLSPAFDTVGLFAADLGLLSVAFDVIAGTESQTEHIGGAAESGKTIDLSLLGASADRDVQDQVTDRVAAVPNLAVTSTNGPALLELVDECAPIYDFVRRYEAFEIHRELIAGGADDYQPGVRAKILFGQNLTGEEYRENLDALARLRTRAVKVFDSADFLLTPAIDGPVIRWEDIVTDSAAKFMYYSMPFNVLGWPALTIPVAGGIESQELPESVQLVGPPGSDRALLSFAAQLCRK